MACIDKQNEIMEEKRLKMSKLKKGEVKKGLCVFPCGVGRNATVAQENIDIAPELTPGGSTKLTI